MAPAAVAVLQYSSVHHKLLRVSAKKNLEISEIADAGKKSEIEISAALSGRFGVHMPLSVVENGIVSEE